jgi:molybdate transport system substrate-binding protein
MKALSGLRAVTTIGVLLLLVVGTWAPALRARSAAAAQHRTLWVFAAASLSDAFTEIGHRLELERPGLDVRISFAGSQQLAAQIEQGAAADVFASADDRWMIHLRDRGLLVGDSKVFARNRLVVIIPKTNPARIRGLQDLARGGVRLVLGTDAVPVGHYSRTALQNLARDPAFGADFATRTQRNVVSEEENVKSVVAKVQLGEADAGMAYRSDVTPAVARYVRILEIPEAANVVASYPIATLKGATAREAGDAFVALVLSPEGQAILEHSGLLPVAGAGR